MATNHRRRTLVGEALVETWTPYVQLVGVDPARREPRVPRVRPTSYTSLLIPRDKHQIDKRKLRLTPKTLKYHGDQRVYSTWNHHKCHRQLFLINLNTYVMGLYTAIIIYTSSYVIIWRLQTSDSDVWRRSSHWKLTSQVEQWYLTSSGGFDTIDLETSWINVGLPLVQCRRRWTNGKPTLI